MKTQKKYTKKEIESNINVLSNDLTNLLANRKSVNQKVRDKRKQIEYWEDLDDNQIKMF